MSFLEGFYKLAVHRCKEILTTAQFTQWSESIRKLFALVSDTWMP